MRMNTLNTYMNGGAFTKLTKKITQTNGRFNCCIPRIHIHNVPLCNKLRMCHNFVNHIFSLSLLVMETRMLISQLCTKGHCKLFYSIAQCYFTKLKHIFYEYRRSSFEVKGVARDIKRDAVLFFHFLSFKYLITFS